MSSQPERKQILVLPTFEPEKGSEEEEEETVFHSLDGANLPFLLLYPPLRKMKGEQFSLWFGNVPETVSPLFQFTPLSSLWYGCSGDELLLLLSAIKKEKEFLSNENDDIGAVDRFWKKREYMYVETILIKNEAAFNNKCKEK